MKIPLHVTWTNFKWPNLFNDCMSLKRMDQCPLRRMDQCPRLTVMKAKHLKHFVKQSTFVKYLLLMSQTY